MFKHRIGTEFNTGGEFDLYRNWMNAFLKLSQPQTARYFPYTKLQPRANYGQAIRGPSYAKILWLDLDNWEYEQINKFVKIGRTNSLLYLTMDLVSELYPQGTWADIWGVPQVLTGQLNTAGTGKWSNVVLQINNVFVLNPVAVNF